MIANLTRRFILISLIFAVCAGLVAYAVGHQERHSPSWVAGQPVPCISTENGPCTGPKNN
ncbi:hypothetical protein [Hoeflea prorocentri]|uniref:Uncharacterized protein n=1 Tax=Hoeflea prorocentri TaxID=1922333 RepID=A0A9X3UJC1_9HYPH|nr:hypothetical protein [Hoeflea prorocentri]MCY6381485.1 hypothetical protein [Hoeflea prorocentri]MDA5399285.1 hypothetical protein [Hoeflea prorocentri]